VSNPDSFIEEVTEEVRRDRLFGLFRRYGWIGGVLVLAVIGGSIWTEWSGARDQARAEAFGDAVLSALDQPTPADRRAALMAVPAQGDERALVQLLLGSDRDGDRAQALAALEALAADAALPVAYRDLAVLRRVLLAGADLPLADRRTALQAIAVAGRPYRPLAEELLAYLLVEEGRTEEAIAAMTTLVQDQEASGALRARVSQMITALGGTLPEQDAG
jgi:hypothetical protein